MVIFNWTLEAITATHHRPRKTLLGGFYSILYEILLSRLTYPLLHQLPMQIPFLSLSLYGRHTLLVRLLLWILVTPGTKGA